MHIEIKNSFKNVVYEGNTGVVLKNIVLTVDCCLGQSG